jgi:hypothetical protein
VNWRADISMTEIISRILVHAKILGQLREKSVEKARFLLKLGRVRTQMRADDTKLTVNIETTTKFYLGMPLYRCVKSTNCKFEKYL